MKGYVMDEFLYITVKSVNVTILVLVVKRLEQFFLTEVFDFALYK